MRETSDRASSFRRASRQHPCHSRRYSVHASVLLAFLMGSLGGYAMRPGQPQLTQARTSQEGHEDLSPAEGAASTAGAPFFSKLIVVGFMGGNVSASNLVHRESVLTLKLQKTYPDEIHAALFANRDGSRAFDSIVQLLSGTGDRSMTEAQKRAARIVIFGHSWGASETVNLANRLNKVGIPVLLTVQVDSVQKHNQNDERIPPNVREAVNFFQAEGLLRGRTSIVAADPARTTILGNFQSSYKQNPISCTAYPWYAQAFMKRHIQIENDPAVWDRIEAMIVAKTM